MYKSKNLADSPGSGLASLLIRGRGFQAQMSALWGKS
jgi:hypothetical protein